MCCQLLCSKQEVKRIFEECTSQEFLDVVSADRLKKIIKLASATRKRRFLRDQSKRYGNLRRGFSDDQVERFFNVPMKPKVRLAFSCMMYLGLRVGECCSLHVTQINFTDKMIMFETPKTGVFDCIPMCDEIYRLLLSWCAQDRVQKGGYVFFSDNKIQKRKHICEQYLGREFRRVAKEADTNISYGTSRERKNTKTSRRLYQFTTHSLRHTFGYKVRRVTKDIEVTRSLLRHADLKSTQIYASASQEEMSDAVELVFD